MFYKFLADVLRGRSGRFDVRTPVGAVIAIAVIGAQVPAARADVVTNYVFSSNASGDLFGSEATNVSGSFSFDYTTGYASNVNIVLSGVTGGDAVYMGTYTSTGIANTFAHAQDTGSTDAVSGSLNGDSSANLVLIEFSTLLDTSPAPISFVGIYPSCECAQDGALSSIQGTANADLPEPATLALLGGFTTVLGMIRRRRGA